MCARIHSFFLYLKQNIKEEKKLLVVKVGGIRFLCVQYKNVVGVANIK